MTSRRSIMLGLVLGAFLSALSLNVAYAQVPRSISYQGLLVKNNLPVNAQVTVHIAIYNAAGGTPLYQETVSQVQVTNGLFNILIGGNQGLLPLGLKFDEQYFLGIDVDGTGEVSPRTPFAAAPYSMNSQTVGGIGVSVTPQPGMLLPLDANGKIPKTALPQATQTLQTIDQMPGDLAGNIKLNAGPGISITDQSPGQITIGLLGGIGSPDTLAVGPGLTGGGIGTKWLISLAHNNWITNDMLGTGVVTGMKIDQNVPQWGLYQDQLGDLNIGLDNTLSFTSAPTQNSAPSRSFPSKDGIGLNLANPNTWTGTQTFSAFPTSIIVNGASIFNGPVTLTPGTLTINGTPEPTAPPNGATYEIQDNGDLRVTGSTTTQGNTYLGVGPTNTINTLGFAGTSANTITGATNTVTATTSNTIQAPTDIIGTAGSSTNTIQGLTNNMTGGTNNLTGTTNNVNATTNNVGTVGPSTNNIGIAGNATNNIVGTTNNVNGTTNNIGTTGVTTTNNIGTLGTTANNTNGLNNTTTATGTNSYQAPTINIGTTVANANTTIGNTANNTSTTIAGLTATMNATTNNIGTQAGVVTNNFGTGGASLNTIGTATSTNTINGTTTFNGNATRNGNTTLNGNLNQISGTTTLLTTQTGNLTVIGTLTQSGGNAAIAGGAVNSFGTVAGSTNAIGAAGSTNTYNGQNNFAGNISQLSGTTTLLNTQVNGTLGSTGNLTLGTISSNNNIGNAGAINTITGSQNNLVGGINNLTGTVNNVNASVNNIGNNSGSVNNIGTVSGGGISTTNVGNLNAGTNNNVSGTTTFTGATLAADGTQILRITGGPQSCNGAFPTALTSQVFADGDMWVAGTLSACRLNIFGAAGGSCIANLNTTTFGSCAGGVTPINLISSIAGTPAGTVDITGIRNFQATNNIQTNVTLTIGVPGTNATNITSSNGGPATIALQTPSVAGKIPTFQQYQLALVPGTGPNGGGSVTFTTVNAPGLIFDANSGMSVAYRTHLPATPVGELWVTQSLTTVTVESSAAGDANTVQIMILRP